MKDTRDTESHILTMPPADARVAMPEVSQEVTESDIARRAHERFLERGGEHGHDLDDWLEAEREVRETATSQVA